MRGVSVPIVLTAVGAGIAIWLSFGALGVTDAASGRRLGLLPPFWVLSLSIAATVTLFSTVPGVRHTARALKWSLLILLPWLPVPVPDVFLIWTGPIVRLTWIAIGVCALYRLLRQIDRRRVGFLFDARIAPRIACALAFVACLAVYSKQQFPPIGDEPHYLLIAHSLLVDHDLTIANNYEHGDYLAYYPGRIWPHYAPPAKDGSLYSQHAPGLPVLIAPALALGGYRGVVLWIAAIGAVGTLFVWKAAYALTSDVAAAWVAWAAASLTAPAALQSTLIYPDSVAGTVLSAAVLAMLTASSLSIPRAIALGLGIGVLPWLHTRFAPLAAILTVAVALRLTWTQDSRRSWPTVVALIIPIIASVTAWLLFFAEVYGTFNPLSAYAGQSPLQPRGVVKGVLGLLLDQEFGLIPNGPVHLLWIGGALALSKHHKRLLLELSCIAVPYVLAVAAFPNWFGGSTPGRYLAPLVFPLAVMVAALWSRQDDFGRSLSAALLTVSVLIVCGFAVGASGTLAYNAAEGRSAFLDWIAPMVNLPAGFPSYFRAITPDGPVRGSVFREFILPSAVWVIATIGMWSVSRWIHNRSAADTVSRPALAAGCLVGVLSIGVAGTWQIGKAPHLIATRAQLELIAREDPATTPHGLQFMPLRVMSSATALRQLEITTSPLGPPPTAAMLTLSEVPPGEYLLRVRLVAEPRGEISLLVGRAGGPLVTWRVSGADDVYRFRIPIRASTLIIVGDAAAAESIRSVALVPVRHVATPWAAVTRARAAARYGRTVVYAIDNRVIIERDGFWVLGGRQPDVVIATERSQPELTLQVSNVATQNRVRVSTGAFSASRELAPDERWFVTVPLPDSLQPAIVNFRVEQGAMMAGQSLGCHISIVE